MRKNHPPPIYNCLYCGKYYCKGECQNTCYHCGSQSCNGGCQSTGGGGGGGTTNPPVDPEPEPECPHIICGDCKLPINPDGSATRSTLNCSHSGSCICPWWGSGHNKLLEDALGEHLSVAQLDAVKEGSKKADQNQEVTNAHLHAMVADGKTIEEAKLKMKEHFVNTIGAYKTSNDYESLGHALHMVQDIYSPAHSLKDWDGSIISYIPHIFEGRIFNRPEFNDALEATKDIFDRISQCESSAESIGAVFDEWLSDYESQYITTN